MNHVILPKGFKKTVAEDYWHLREHVQLWDVGCQRQVEVQGTDAARLAQLMTPRNLSQAKVGDCLYAPMTDHNGGMLNDPVIMKLANDRFWFSIADADMLLWAKGLALGMQLDVSVQEPDVWPMAVQGPKSNEVMTAVFDSSVADLGFFKFQVMNYDGISCLVARSGFSKQGGFEIYVDGADLALKIWDAVWEAGQDFNLSPGCPNLPERIEGGLLSYGNEMTINDNPFECGLGRYCDLSGNVDYVGLEALQRIHQTGIQKTISGFRFTGNAAPACSKPWKVFWQDDKTEAGYLTSVAWSPRFEENIALGMLYTPHDESAPEVKIIDENGIEYCGRISALPM